MPEWKFITNHGAVLAFISQRQRVTAREIASSIQVTERSVVRILGDLEADGYVKRSREGRVNTYEIQSKLPLRHEIANNVSVEDFLKLFKK
jgi:Mn-dependent DtxR family transcriptional regulator